MLIAALAVLLAASAAQDTPVLRSSAPSRFEAPRDDKARAAPPVRVVERTATPSAPKVNVNTADVKTLMTLTGVSRKVAERIVEYRDTHGPFKKAADVRRVEGVGNGVWEKNRERIVVK